MTVVAVGVLSALTSLTSSVALDEELAQRSVALRAAVSRMEAVLAYDYATGPEELVAYWSDPARSTFDVDGLRRPASEDGGEPPPCGAVSFDATDPVRIGVTVTVSWRSRGGSRSLSLPTTITAVVK